MHVCVDDGGAPRVVGWTSLETDAPHLQVPRPLLMPLPPGGLFDTEIEVLTFETRIAHRGQPPIPERAIILREGDDPTLLPGWRPMVDTDVRHRVFVRHMPNGPDMALVQLTPTEFQACIHMRPTPRAQGVPVYWCENGYGGIQVWPEPAEGYEIIDNRERQPMAIPREDMLDIGSRLWGILENALGYPPSPDGLRQQQQAVLAHHAARLERAAVRAGDGYARPPEIFFGIDPERERDQNVVSTLGAGGGGGGLAEVFLEWQWRAALLRIETESDKAARERARGLLKSMLLRDQWDEFIREGRITERIGDREFVIRPRQMIEVRKPRLFGRSQQIERWCVNPEAFDGNSVIPSEDLAIGQLLHLRAGPDKLKKTANVFHEGLL